MAKAIPISNIVKINPGVIGSGGNPLALNGVFVSDDSDIPVGSLLSFSSADDVGEYFGVSSAIADIASKYFLSFDNSQKKPQSMIFAPFASESVGAWVRGASIAGMTLAEAKAITGGITVTINGTQKTVDSVDFSSATSFSDIASTLNSVLSLTGVASVSWSSIFSCYYIRVTATGAESTISAVTGAAAVSLGLAAGVVSQGADSDTVNTCMNRIKELSLNWATFTVLDNEIGTKAGFADWTNRQNRRYLYVPWDNDAQALVEGSDCFGNTCKVSKWEAVLPVYNNAKTAAMVMGSLASIDWKATNGRIDLAFKSQSGLTPVVYSNAEYTALKANGYTFYGCFAAAGEDNILNMLYNGQLPGSDYGFGDTFANQIYLNSQLQLSIATGLNSVRSVPYNSDGYAMVRNWCMTPITEALNNGTIRAGVNLSQAQKAQIISAIGFDVSDEIYASGYYLYIGDADAQTRGQRKSPPITLLYTDGGSIQQIELGSIVII